MSTKFVRFVLELRGASMGFDVVSWRWEQSNEIAPITIDKVFSCGSTLFAVRQLGACMSRSGVWRHETLLCDNDPSFTSDYRFDSWQSAADAILQFCDGLGRLKPGVTTIV